MVYNEKIKTSIELWRQNNKQRWNDYHNEKQKEYNTRHRTTILEKKKEAYDYKKFINNTNPKYEWVLFCNISIFDTTDFLCEARPED
jgi:hypothetical protein